MTNGDNSHAISICWELAEKINRARTAARLHDSCRLFIDAQQAFLSLIGMIAVGCYLARCSVALCGVRGHVGHLALLVCSERRKKREPTARRNMGVYENTSAIYDVAGGDSRGKRGESQEGEEKFGDSKKEDERDERDF